MNSFLATVLTNSTNQTLQPYACIKFTGFTYSESFGALAEPSDDVVGIVFEPISPTKKGNMVMMGVVTNINTNAWNTGDALYCGLDGYLTTTANGLQVATVLSKHANGAIYVNTLSIPQQNGQVVGNGAANQLTYWTGAGTVAGNANIKVNPTLQGFDLGLGTMSGWLGPISILNNQPTPQLLISYSQSGNEDAIIRYSIVRDGQRQIGELWVTSTPSSAGISYGLSETEPLGINFSVQLNAGNIEIYYTSPNSGFNANFRYRIERWGGT